MQRIELAVPVTIPVVLADGNLEPSGNFLAVCVDAAKIAVNAWVKSEGIAHTNFDNAVFELRFRIKLKYKHKKEEHEAE